MTKSLLSDPIALRIPLEILDRVEAVAAASERTRSWVIVRALKHYLDAEGRDILAALEGRSQIAEGRSHDMDEVLDEIDGLAEGKAA